MHVPNASQTGPSAADVSPAPAEASEDRSPKYLLRVDYSERNAALLDLARECGDFDVRMEHLAIGDYVVNGAIIIERKTYADFAISLADGRLFPQAAALSRGLHRPVVLLEGPRPPRMPNIHPHALKGAMVSLAVMWRLPVLCARHPKDSLQILRFLAQQVGASGHGILKRYDRKPKRFASRKLYMLQGLPGVGPALAHRLLIEFGSVERVVTASERALMQVRGLGPKKAARIRKLVSHRSEASEIRIPPGSAVVYTGRESFTMIRTVEAVIDEDGNIRLLEPVRPPTARRALVTILEEGPATQVSESALLSEEALAQDWDRPEEDEAWSHIQPGQ